MINIYGSIFGSVLAIGARLLVVDIDIIDLAASLTLILVVYLHYFDLFLPILNQLQLVFLHQILTNAQGSHLLWSFHFDDHVVQNKIGF